jgi:hypothetical protein
VGLRAGLDWCGKFRPHRDFFFNFTSLFALILVHLFYDNLFVRGVISVLFIPCSIIQVAITNYIDGRTKKENKDKNKYKGRKKESTELEWTMCPLSMIYGSSSDYCTVVSLWCQAAHWERSSR